MSRNLRANSYAGPAMDLVPTPVGKAGVTWYPAHGSARAVALLGHGSATGVEAPDLQALAAALPRQGVTVALVTQPYRLSRARTGSDEWVKLFAPDGVLEFPYAPVGVPRRVTGRDALFAHMSRFPETFDVKFVDLVFHDTVDPNLVIAEFRSTGTALPTGKPYEQTCISVVRTDDDALITHYLDYWNPLVAIEALTPDGVPSDAEASVAFGG